MSRILNVVWGPFPDIRLDKTGRHLGEAGHQVDVLCTEKRKVDWPWGDVIEAPLPTSLPQRLFHRALFNLRRDPTVLPWRMRAAFAKVLARARYDVIQWNDLPGLLDGVAMARAHGARIVFDMHENHADNMWSTERDLGTPSWLYSMNAWLRYEAKAVMQVDRVLVNIEEMGQRLTGMHGLSPDRIAVVRNAEPPEAWAEAGHDPALRERFRDRLTLLFVSSCSLHRGIDVLVRAMAQLDDLPQAQLVVVGDGNGLPHWKRLAAELGVTERVSFEGRVPFKRALEYYGVGDIGLIPHHKYGQTDNGIPHKYAQNLTAGLPVLVSSCHALERVTREIGCGEVFAAGDPAAAGAAIRRMADPELRARMAQAGRQAATDGIFSWRRMGEDMSAAYQGLIA